MTAEQRENDFMTALQIGLAGLLGSDSRKDGWRW